ncbi:MAG TPA: amidohydrolase family protein [Burkholderiales bacterium]|nr:amidohydrolase family protein [Burkholderiales bacterium]
MKLDIFNHIFPRNFYDRMLAVLPDGRDMNKRVRAIPSIVDLDARFRIMDTFPDYSQVICLPQPPIESLGPPPVSSELARIGNDGMAELVAKHPDRFPAFVAGLPMNDPEGLLREAERAIKELGAVGVQVFSNVNGAPLTAPETLPLFGLMAELDLPIWLHPARGADRADYTTEKKSHYEIWWTFGWPYETSVAMAHMVFAGLFDKHPDLKIITHHLGAMVPYFEGRVGPGWDQLGTRTSDEDYGALLKKLKKRPLDYFHLFYADTAVFGSRAATECGLKFFGADRVLFGSDAPFDPEKGSAYIRWTIEIVDRLEITPAERSAIYEGNARRLLKLPVSGVRSAKAVSGAS